MTKPVTELDIEMLPANSQLDEMADSPRPSEHNENTPTPFEAVPLTANTERGAVIGSLVGVSPNGTPLVDHPANPHHKPREAASVVTVTADDVGRKAVLVFENNNPAKPIVLGLIQRPRHVNTQAVQIKTDGEQLVLSAQREIVLKCGQASLTLTRAGKVLIRGKYLLSRSSGVNRIKGGSVQIN